VTNTELKAKGPKKTYVVRSEDQGVLGKIALAVVGLGVMGFVAVVFGSLIPLLLLVIPVALIFGKVEVTTTDDED